MPFSASVYLSYLPLTPIFPIAAIVLSVIVTCSHYQPYMRRITMPSRLSDKIISWCTERQSITDVVASNPDLSPGEAAKQLFGNETISIGKRQAPDATQRGSLSNSSTSSIHSEDSHASMIEKKPSPQELKRALACGNFGDTIPSELFTSIWHDALLTLECDPMAGCVSPSLMGSTGTLPMTVIGTVWDVCRHMSNLIVRAEKEVFLATNFWQPSGPSTLITDALRELSLRAGRQQKRVTVKILYDRGSLKQVFRNHVSVPSSEYSGSKIAIPSPEEIPNIDLQVTNYHRPALGTFHAKFMVVDRKFGVICSNNIMRSENLEMMSHLEGPIVNSLYDVCLVSWNEHIVPPLQPSSELSAAQNVSSFEDPAFKELFDENGHIVSRQDSPSLPMHIPGDPHYDVSIAKEFWRMQSNLMPTKEKTHLELVTAHLNAATDAKLQTTAPGVTSSNEFYTPFIPHPPHAAFPMALVNRKPAGAPNNSSLHVPQNAAWISALRNAKKKVFIQTPNLNSSSLLPEIISAVKRGVEVEYWVCLGYNDAGELLPAQGGTNEMVAAKLHEDLQHEPEEVRQRLKVGWYVGKDQNRVIHKKEGGRCCHIKLMIADEQVGIQGNGNQDTQSWFHSQEVNVMIDSEIVCKSWMESIRRNQNTHLYGMGSTEDGLWRDGDGNQAKDAIGKNPGRFSWATGAIGAVQRVRGLGGF